MRSCVPAADPGETRAAERSSSAGMPSSWRPRSGLSMHMSVPIISATELCLHLQTGKRTHGRARIALPPSVHSQPFQSDKRAGVAGLASPPCSSTGWLLRLCSQCHPGKRAPAGGCWEKTSRILCLLSFSQLLHPSVLETSLLPIKNKQNPCIIDICIY